MRVIETAATGRKRSYCALVAACAVAPAMFFGIATAHADPDPDPNAPIADPEAWCKSPEVGGIFTAGVDDNGAPRSVCQYNVDGYAYYDTYQNGAYTGTTVYRDGQQVPTPRPDLLPLFEMPSHIPMLPFF